ncbi:hypothetical protein [Sphingomonas sp.]|uniref:hypothetical protein n=1 Tax=Sphingomonas sp. TaxID=28214 RepID=UPI003D6D0E8B
MTGPVKVMLALLAFSGAAGVSDARTPTSKAEAIIAASKRATGGTAWDKPQGCFEAGTHADGAISYRTRFRLFGYGMRIDSERGGATRSMGFNGKASWQAAGNDKADVRSDPASLRDSIVTNYLSINGFFFPDRFPATFNYLREVREAGKRLQVIEITPRGGRSFEAWFDSRTHLIRRVVDRHGVPPTTVEARDYRKAGDLTIAFKLNVLGPDGAVADRGAVTSFHCGPIENTIFDPPLPR